jgi:Co/Zn/Cd efflux system component
MEEDTVIWRSWSWGDWLMACAVVFFVLAGVAKLIERQGRLGLALVLLGLANALLLTLSRR